MNNNIIPVYQPMKDAVKTTGLSEYYLRKLLKAGKLPHIKNGAKIFVNVPVSYTHLTLPTTMLV